MVEADPKLAKASFLEAYENKLPFVVTARHNNSWEVFRCRLASVGKEWTFEVPRRINHGEFDHKFFPGETLGFRLTVREKQFAFPAKVIACSQNGSAEDTLTAFKVQPPDHMHQINRRVEPRVDIPQAKQIRIALWPGTRHDEPKDDDLPDHPVWAGDVVDVSRSGAMLRVHHSAMDLLDSGDLMGLRLTFSKDPGTLLTTGQLVHAKQDGKAFCLLGVRFTLKDTSKADLETAEQIEALIQWLAE